MSGKPLTIALVLAATAAAGHAGGGATGPRQPVGAIVNPSIEALDADGRPAHWTIEPRPRREAIPVHGWMPRSPTRGRTA